MGKYSEGAVKMHTLIDLRGSIPVFIHIADVRFHDSNILDLLNITPINSIYTMDKAMLISMRSIELIMKKHYSSLVPNEV